MTAGSIIEVQPGDTETGDDSNCEDGDENDPADANATPGALNDGQGLAADATLTVDEAVTIAQGAASGQLGSVDLENQNDTLVYRVNIGD